MKTQFFLLNEVHGTRKYFSSVGMKTWEACLCNSDFFRVHKCYVVNLNYVKELKEVKGEEFAVMTTEIRIPVSQRNKVEFRKVWKQFAKRRK
jgi:DNA-binding LytR/AlgR family response regulator